MPSQVSAVDSISPAFARTKRLLFGPFRLGLWARLAVVALVTGEAGGGGGGGASLPNLNQNRGGHNHWAAAARLLNKPDWDQVRPYLAWIVLGALVVLALMLLWIYSDCVYRFILLESVITGQCRLREGWRRWREAGRRYMLWVIGYAISSLVLLGLVIGVPVWLAYSAGWFEKPDDHLGALIGGGMLLGLLFLALAALLAIIDLLARDFLVPVMAFEDVGVEDGWRRLWGMVSAEKIAFGGYVVMKIVLAMGSAIIFTIVNLIVILVLLIPLAILGVAAFFIGKGAGIIWDTPAILLVSGLGMLGLAGILYVMGFVYAPGLVFFQSYTLEFFASRYGPLANRMFPPSPPATPPIAPILPPEPFTA
ncbi:MAG: hypothetical protein WA817_10410 [Candidatus Acidiferrum sp.]